MGDVGRPDSPAAGVASPPPTPDGAAAVFGDRLLLARRYVELLATTGIEHGLIGPREAPRLWERHVLNCAVVAPLFRPGASVADVGSGAGLPGIPLAIARPDLELTLVEPLLRRTRWLESGLADLAGLGLENVRVHRGRAESLWDVTRFDHVTARAVARTAELARWTLPLLVGDGSLHALKGEQAAEELGEDAGELARLGATRWEVTRHGAGVVDPETVVASVYLDHLVEPLRSPARAKSGRRRGASSRRRRPPAR